MDDMRLSALFNSNVISINQGNRGGGGGGGGGGDNKKAVCNG